MHEHARCFDGEGQPGLGGFAQAGQVAAAQACRARYVISARYGDSSPYSTVRQRCEARPLLLAEGEDFVLYALLSFVIENYRPLLDSIFEELEQLEQTVLSQPLSPAEIEHIANLRHDLLRLRRQIAPLAEICRELQQLEFPFIDKPMRPYFRDIVIHVSRL